MPYTVENQKVIRIHKPQYFRDFLQVAKEEWMAVNKTLGPYGCSFIFFSPPTPIILKWHCPRRPQSRWPGSKAPLSTNICGYWRKPVISSGERETALTFILPLAWRNKERIPTSTATESASCKPFRETKLLFRLAKKRICRTNLLFRKTKKPSRHAI